MLAGVFSYILHLYKTISTYTCIHLLYSISCLKANVLRHPTSMLLVTFNFQISIQYILKHYTESRCGGHC